MYRNIDMELGVKLLRIIPRRKKSGLCYVLLTIYIIQSLKLRDNISCTIKSARGNLLCFCKCLLIVFFVQIRKACPWNWDTISIGIHARIKKRKNLVCRQKNVGIVYSLVASPWHAALCDVAWFVRRIEFIHLDCQYLCPFNLLVINRIVRWAGEMPFTSSITDARYELISNLI